MEGTEPTNFSRYGCTPVMREGHNLPPDSNTELTLDRLNDRLALILLGRVFDR